MQESREFHRLLDAQNEKGLSHPEKPLLFLYQEAEAQTKEIIVTKWVIVSQSLELRSPNS